MGLNINSWSFSQLTSFHIHCITDTFTILENTTEYSGLQVIQWPQSLGKNQSHYACNLTDDYMKTFHQWFQEIHEMKPAPPLRVEWVNCLKPRAFTRCKACLTHIRLDHRGSADDNLGGESSSLMKRYSYSWLSRRSGYHGEVSAYKWGNEMDCSLRNVKASVIANLSSMFTSRIYVQRCGCIILSMFSTQRFVEGKWKFCISY